MAVQVVKDRLVAENGKAADISLRPERGFVFVQGTVAYAELSHTPAFDQPHVFKVGHSHGSRVRDVHYFMAKSFQEKAAWIEALEKVTLTREAENKEAVDQEENVGISLSPTKANGGNSDLINFDVVATFPASGNGGSGGSEGIVVFCALSLEDDEGRVLFGTSRGLFLGSSSSSPSARPLFKQGGGPEGVFQLGRMKEFREVLMVAGPERRLLVAREEDLFGEEDMGRFRHRNIEVVSSCHRFAAHCYDNSEEKADRAFVCAVDDRRVSILARLSSSSTSGEYRLRHGFSTDLPTSCICFSRGDSPRFVLVATDKVYQIGLGDFGVREFVDPAVAPSVFADNRLADMFALGKRDTDEEEFLLCFQVNLVFSVALNRKYFNSNLKHPLQDYGLFLDSSGRRSRGDLRWGGTGGRGVVVGQFSLTREESVSPPGGSPTRREERRPQTTLWLARRDALEGLDVDVRSGSANVNLRCGGPQILSSAGAGVVVFAERKADTTIVRSLNRK